MAESLHCSPETITTLLIGCTPIQNIKGFFFFFKNKGMEGSVLTKKKNVQCRDVPSGSLVKNPSASAGDMGLIPDPGESHMAGSN